MQVARICAEFNVPHLVNNAYGLSSTICMGLLTEAHRQGRLDLFVQSTDKNLLVPVRFLDYNNGERLKYGRWEVLL